MMHISVIAWRIAIHCFGNEVTRMATLSVALQHRLIQ